MSKNKSESNIFKILLNGLNLYFSNIGKFSQYMLFPVFGQIAGGFLVFGLNYYFLKRYAELSDKYIFLQDYTTIMFIVLIISIPGMIIIFKALWDYLVAYGALNSMTDALLTTNKLYDFKAHNETVTTKSGKFILILLILSILTLLTAIPFFMIIGAILFVYFILIMQVFTFETEQSILGCFKKSFNLIKGNFAKTFILMLILGIICYGLLGSITEKLLDIIKLSNLIKGVFENWAMTMPYSMLNDYLAKYNMQNPITPLFIANLVFSSMVTFIVTGLTLPLRSICWTLWYKNLSDKTSNAEKNKKIPKQKEKDL